MKNITESRIHCVRDKRTQKILNLRGGWSRAVNSYRVAVFDSESSAKAAFPQGFECEVVSAGGGPVPDRASSGTVTDTLVKFYVLKGTKVLAADDSFQPMGDKSAAFVSEDAALDKADALGLDLDDILVISSKVKPIAPVEG